MPRTPGPDLPHRDYSTLTRPELETRLTRAEDALVVLSWCPKRWDTPKEIACHTLWRRWLYTPGTNANPGGVNAHLDPTLIDRLVAQHHADRALVVADVHDHYTRTRTDPAGWNP